MPNCTVCGKSDEEFCTETATICPRKRVFPELSTPSQGVCEYCHLPFDNGVYCLNKHCTENDIEDYNIVKAILNINQPK